MPTSVLAIDWEEKQEQQSPEPTEMSCLEDTLQGSRLLLKAQRQELEAEIAHARNILGQSELADEEGIYSEETLDRAVAFLKMYAEGLWESYALKAPVPAIGPGPAGSVDLFWEQASWKLLVNIPAATDALATFYADDHGRQKIKGSFDPNKFSVNIAACLMA